MSKRYVLNRLQELSNRVHEEAEAYTPGSARLGWATHEFEGYMNALRDLGVITLEECIEISGRHYAKLTEINNRRWEIKTA